MAKKKNSILEEQRRAREEFLKLKRMQQGESVESAPTSRYEPVTLSQKADNFWYHNKWYVISLMVVVIILAVMITQCATKKEYDLQVVYFSYTATTELQTEKIADYLGQFVEDINGDGEADVQVINCSINNDMPDRNYRDSILQKIQATVVGSNKAMLYITDKESIGYFGLLDTSIEIFDGEPIPLNEEFYKAVRIDSIEVPALPSGLQISIRNISGSILEMQSDTELYLKESRKLLEAITAQK